MKMYDLLSEQDDRLRILKGLKDFIVSLGQEFDTDIPYDEGSLSLNSNLYTLEINLFTTKLREDSIIRALDTVKEYLKTKIPGVDKIVIPPIFTYRIYHFGVKGESKLINNSPVVIPGEHVFGKDKHQSIRYVYPLMDLFYEKQGEVIYRHSLPKVPDGLRDFQNNLIRLAKKKIKVYDFLKEGSRGDYSYKLPDKYTFYVGKIHNVYDSLYHPKRTLEDFISLNISASSSDIQITPKDRSNQKVPLASYLEEVASDRYDLNLELLHYGYNEED